MRPTAGPGRPGGSCSAPPTSGEEARMPQQRVLVTAGASGIGREFTRAFAEANSHVFVVDIDAEGLEALERDIPGVQTAVCDMSSRTDIKRMVPEAVAALGGLDVLVNNAGISGPTAPVEDY